MQMMMLVVMEQSNAQRDFFEKENTFENVQSSTFFLDGGIALAVQTGALDCMSMYCSSFWCTMHLEMASFYFVLH